MIQSFILLIIACGDHPNHIADIPWDNQTKLGTVDLKYSETYLSCRKLCRDAHPDFQFYHKFINYQSCDCIKISSGVVITMKEHGAYTFGYSQECGRFII